MARLTEVHALTVADGEDLRQAVDKVVQENRISAGVVLAAAGRLARVNFRLPSTPARERTFSDIGLYTIVAISGMVSVRRSHLHIGVADEHGSMWGGHLLKGGNLVSGEARLLIGEIDGLAFDSEFDPRTGYDELAVRRDDD